MSTTKIGDIPWEMWWLFIGVFLFGLLLPFVSAQGVLKVWYSISHNQVKDGQEKLSFWWKVAIGWVTLLPVYIISFYYFNLQLDNL